MSDAGAWDVPDDDEADEGYALYTGPILDPAGWDPSLPVVW